MRTSAIGTEDTHGRSTPHDQLFSHGQGREGASKPGILHWPLSNCRKHCVNMFLPPMLTRPIAGEVWSK